MVIILTTALLHTFLVQGLKKSWINWSFSVQKRLIICLVDEHRFIQPLIQVISMFTVKFSFSIEENILFLIIFIWKLSKKSLKFWS